MCNCRAPLEIQEVRALAQLAYETVIAMNSSFGEQMAPFAQLGDDSLVWLDTLVEMAVYGGDVTGCYDKAHALMEYHGWEEATPFFMLDLDRQDAHTIFHSVVVAALVVVGVR